MSMKLMSWVSSQTFPQNNSVIGHQADERLESDLDKYTKSNLSFMPHFRYGSQ